MSPNSTEITNAHFIKSYVLNKIGERLKIRTLLFLFGQLQYNNVGVENLYLDICKLESIQ